MSGSAPIVPHPRLDAAGTRLRCRVLLLGVVMAISAPVGAQVRIAGPPPAPAPPPEAKGWAGLLAKIPPASRGRPIGMGDTQSGFGTPAVRCGYAMELPDSLALAGAVRADAGIYLWSNFWSSGETTLEQYQYPEERDTLVVRVRDAWCYDADSRSAPNIIVVQAGDDYLAINSSILLSQREVVGWKRTPIHVATRGRRGWGEGYWSVRCTTENGTPACTGRILDARPAIDSARRQAAARARASIAAMRAQGWSEADILSIRNGQIRIGMSAAQVRAAWGAPDRVYTTTTGSALQERWVYAGGYSTVTLVNDRVRVIQQ